MTPSTTKLKSDALLELRDINLKINEANGKLEAIQANCVAESSVLTTLRKEREVLESAFSRIGEKFEVIDNSKERDLDDLDKEIEKKKGELSSVLADKSKIEKDIDALGIAKIALIKDLDATIEDKNNLLISLDHDIQIKKEESESAKKELSDTLSKNKEISERTALAEQRLSERESSIEEKEKICARNASEVRVWAVRLYQKYEEYMTEHEKKIIESYTK